MRPSQALTAILLYMLAAVSWASLGVTGEPSQAALMSLAGQVKAITIDLFGLQPGRCAGAMVLAQKEGGEVSLAITPEIRITRGQQSITIDDMGVGDAVKGLAIHLPGEPLARIMMLEVTTP